MILTNLWLRPFQNLPKYPIAQVWGVIFCSAAQFIADRSLIHRHSPYARPAQLKKSAIIRDYV
jgi:hypothetical protein